MKAQIIITGQTDSRYAISNKLHCYYDKKGFELKYQTMTSARKDLISAYHKLKDENPDYEEINLSNDILSFDAGIAKIIRDENN